MKLEKIKEIVIIFVIVIFFLGICFALVSVLTGCTMYDEVLDKEDPKPEVIEKEVIKEVIKEKIVYRDRNITNECPVYNNNTPRERELELIRRLRYHEEQQNLYFNDSECNWELNQSNKELEKCENELCYEWNESWC